MNPSSLKNYRDLSVRDGPGAGLQYEFYCKCCDFTWKSPKQTLKTARTLGFLSRLSDLAGLLGNANARSLAIKASSATRFATASAGGKAAQAALEEAQAQAVRYFEACVTCGDACCDSCVVDASGQCRRCVEQGKGQTPAHGGDGYGGGAAAHGGGSTVCPNCQAAAEGGRFCHECGFDMASTHKSCPTCGSVMSRAARFCTDCGHGF
jgi:hypothetical protein